MAVSTISRVNAADLFSSFIKERAEEDFPSLARQLNAFGHHNTTMPANLRDTADALRTVAEDFANSAQRQKVKRQAMSVDKNLIDQQMLMNMIEKIVRASQSEGLIESIVVAFYFCYDLLLRVFPDGMGVVNQLIVMCRSSFLEVVDPIVQAAGGWSNILKVTATVGLVVGVVAGAAWLIGKMLAPNEDD